MCLKATCKLPVERRYSAATEHKATALLFRLHNYAFVPFAQLALALCSVKYLCTGRWCRRSPRSAKCSSCCCSCCRTKHSATGHVQPPGSVMSLLNTSQANAVACAACTSWVCILSCLHCELCFSLSLHYPGRNEVPTSLHISVSHKAVEDSIASRDIEVMICALDKAY